MSRNSDKKRVTKIGRPKKYTSNAERQRAYRERQREEKAARVKRIIGRRRKLDPNRIINETVMAFRANGDTLWMPNAHWGELDPKRVPEWIESLLETRRHLNRLIQRLKKLAPKKSHEDAHH